MNQFLDLLSAPESFQHSKILTPLNEACGILHSEKVKSKKEKREKPEKRSRREQRYVKNILKSDILNQYVQADDEPEKKFWVIWDEWVFWRLY